MHKQCISDLVLNYHRAPERRQKDAGHTDGLVNGFPFRKVKEIYQQIQVTVDDLRRYFRRQGVGWSGSDRIGWRVIRLDNTEISAILLDCWSESFL